MHILSVKYGSVIISKSPSKVGMGDMGLKIYHDISGIYCDNDINDDNSGNPVSLEKSIIFPIFTPNRVLWATEYTCNAMTV